MPADRYAQILMPRRRRRRADGVFLTRRSRGRSRRRRRTAAGFVRPRRAGGGRRGPRRRRSARRSSLTERERWSRSSSSSGSPRRRSAAAYATGRKQFSQPIGLPGGRDRRPTPSSTSGDVVAHQAVWRLGKARLREVESQWWACRAGPRRTLSSISGGIGADPCRNHRCFLGDRPVPVVRCLAPRVPAREEAQ